jgi:hypothetical protein
MSSGCTTSLHARALNDVLDELARQHITFALTRAGNHPRENLACSGLLKRSTQTASPRASTTP